MNSELAAGRRGLRFAWIALLLAAALPAGAETLYVTDMLQLDLYATAEMSGRPLRKLRSGDALEVLDKRARTARVRLADGATGWVKSLYLVAEEPARTRVNQLEDANAALSEQADTLQQTVASLRARIAELEDERSSSAEVQAAAEQEALELRAARQELERRLDSYRASVPFSWFFLTTGLALVVGGVAGWYWFDRQSRARHGGYRVY